VQAAAGTASWAPQEGGPGAHVRPVRISRAFFGHRGGAPRWMNAGSGADQKRCSCSHTHSPRSRWDAFRRWDRICRHRVAAPHSPPITSVLACRHVSLQNVPGAPRRGCERLRFMDTWSLDPLSELHSIQRRHWTPWNPHDPSGALIYALRKMCPALLHEQCAVAVPRAPLLRIEPGPAAARIEPGSIARAGTCPPCPFRQPLHTRGAPLSTALAGEGGDFEKITSGDRSSGTPTG